MDESSSSPKNLDPSAKEFHPTPHQNPIFITPITFFPPPPLPPPPPPPQLLFLPYPPPPPTYFNFLQSPVPLPDYVHPSPPPASTGPPSRSLLLTATPPQATEAIVRAEMELFGEVRAVDMERAHEGIVTVHFYDLRDAQTALLEIRAQHMHNHHNNLAALLLQSPFPAPGLIAGCVVWAQFIIPAIIDSVTDGHNHGTIVIFNLDSNVSAQTPKRIFEAFGPVKELRDTPLKRHQKFLEFFDVRDAARAAKEMNGKIIQGKQIAIDFSRPGGGHGRRRWCHASEISQSNSRQQQHSTPAPLPSFRKQSKNICTSPNENIFPAVTDAVASRSHRYQARRPTRTTTATYNDNNNNGSGCSRSFSIISNGGTTAATVDDSTSSSRNGDEANVADFKNICRKVAGAGGGNKSRLGRLKHTKSDSRFVIREDVITDCGDSRTTVMIKNIPNKYSLKLLLTLLDNHCAHCNDQILAGRGGDRAYLSSYDFVYLPMDFNNKCNVGYGFVNMTSPEATMRLYKAFHCQSWEVFNSRKICQVTYARVQVLKEHFRNSKFPSGSDDIFPVVFDPPRDGRGQLTPPQPIYGMAAAASNVSSCKSSEDEQSNDSSHIGSMCCAENVDEVFAELRVEADVTGVEKIRDLNGGSEDVQLCKKN